MIIKNDAILAGAVLTGVAQLLVLDYWLASSPSFDNNTYMFVFVATVISFLFIFNLIFKVGLFASKKLRDSVNADFLNSGIDSSLLSINEIISKPGDIVKDNKVVIILLAFSFSFACALLFTKLLFSSWPYILFLSALLLAAIIDLDTKLLTTETTGTILWAGLIASHQNLVSISLYDALAGVVAGYVLFQLPKYLIGLVGARGKDALGGGDTALLAACGAWLGLSGVLYAGCISFVLAFVATIFSSKSKKANNEFNNEFLAFGPYIALAVMGVFVFDFLVVVY